MSVRERFWLGVVKTDGCWKWTKATNEHGYGIFNLKENGRWRCRLAHRLAWIFSNGPIPDQSCILHHCDNPLCVNPGHLFLGSRADNNLDCRTKGRHRHPFGKLLPEQVAAIRDARKGRDLD